MDNGVKNLDEIKIAIYKNNEKIFEGLMLAKLIEDRAAIEYDDGSWTIVELDKDYEESLKLFLETFLEIWNDVDDIEDEEGGF